MCVLNQHRPLFIIVFKAFALKFAVRKLSVRIEKLWRSIINAALEKDTSNREKDFLVFLCVFFECPPK